MNLKAKIHCIKERNRRKKEDRTAKYFEEQLFSNQIRINAVPVSLLRGELAFRLYAIAFRIDRAVGDKNRFQEDLDFLELELCLAKIRKNNTLCISLEHMYTLKSEEYRLFFGDI